MRKNQPKLKAPIPLVLEERQGLERSIHPRSKEKDRIKIKKKNKIK